jgi:folate-binding protein YgfZ
VARRDFGATPALRVIVPRELLARCEDALVRIAGARRLAEAEVDLARVEAGVPTWGRDFGEEHLPQETGLEALAVSYTKGCYLGQEIVARLHWRGQAPRGLRGIWFAPEARPASGAAVRYLGEVVGRVGTVARSPRLGPIALAILTRRVPVLGVSVEVEGAGPAAVVELPFA